MNKLMLLSGLAAAVAGTVVAGTPAGDLVLYLNADTMKAPVAGARVSSSIRLRPGKFGSAYLIERRTLNAFAPADVVLGDGATLKGKLNTLTLPAGSFAALPLTTIRPGSANTLSFRYRGAGKIRVSFNGVQLAELTATATPQRAEIVVTPKSDSGSLRIANTHPAVLDEVMFDRGINFANTYHAPGPMRYVDVINLPPRLFNRASGAFSCWLKTPWLRSGVSGMNGHILFGALFDRSGKKRPAAAGLKAVCVWGDTLIDSNMGAKGTYVASSAKISEIKNFPADNWVHVVVNWNLVDGRMHSELIINGAQRFTAVKPFLLRPEAQEFNIGYHAGGYTNGLMDDIGLFRRPLTVAEAHKIFSAGKPLPEALK